MLEKIFDPMKAISKVFIQKPMTFNFPPETPLTEGFRGRHLFDPEKCKNCSLCLKICPNEAITMVGEEKKVMPSIDYSKCCFCGLCVDVCPTNALTFSNFPMLVTMDKDSLLYSPEKLAEMPELKEGTPSKTKSIVDWARAKSLWIVHYMTGCCFIEAVPWVGSGFDMERFGLLAKGSPRHSDVLIVGGYVTVKTLKRIIRIYTQMPRPKYVIALGNCPMSGGTYWDCYNTIKKIDDYIPVDIWIAGCPPRPEAIGLAIVHAMDAIKGGYTGKEERIDTKNGSLDVPQFSQPGPRTDEKTYIPFGPCHPASGNFDLGLKLDGERIVYAVPNPGYLHRGFEKLMEYRTWWQNIMLVPRICVLDGASYEVGYVSAVEDVAGLEVPERAKYLRVIQAELSRIQSHLLNLGLIGSAAGFDTVERITWGDRERILLLLEKLTGARIYQIYNIPGGVRRDLPPDFEDSVRETAKYMRKRLRIYDDLLLNNSTFVMRTQRVGGLAGKVAEEHSVTGPNLRATGIEYDVRKANPYAAYGDLEFEVIGSTEGDAFQRTLCRRREIEESLRIIEEALDRIPDGPIAEKKMRNGKAMKPSGPIPEGEAISCVESARGEVCFHAVSKGEKQPYRVKVKGATFDPILVMLPKMLRGVAVADVPVIYWSMDTCPADHDR